MPVLLRYSRMTPDQRAFPAVERQYVRLGLRWDGLAAGELDWRVCVYFRNARDRPCANRGVVFLTASTPREVLGTCEPPDLTGARLVAEAISALDTDLLAAKAPLLVLCDWLEEHGMPEAPLLRAFCWLPQRWDRFCLRTK